MFSLVEGRNRRIAPVLMQISVIIEENYKAGITRGLYGSCICLSSSALSEVHAFKLKQEHAGEDGGTA
jgi:hypothetical protein